MEELFNFTNITKRVENILRQRENLLDCIRKDRTDCTSSPEKTLLPRKSWKLFLTPHNTSLIPLLFTTNYFSSLQRQAIEHSQGQAYLYSNLGLPNQKPDVWFVYNFKCRNSSATHLWEVEAFNVCRGIPQHQLAMSAENFSWTCVHKKTNIALWETEIKIVHGLKTSYCSTLHSFMKTMNFFLKLPRKFLYSHEEA